MKPLCKWSGGKRDEIKLFNQFYPKKYKTYIEPFVGGGAVYFDLNHDGNNVINDVHSDLINFYKQIKDGHAEKIYNIVNKWGLDEEDYYYVRGGGKKLQNKNDVFEPKNKIDEAAKFIYLRRTCFRGMIRYNAKGFFNVPWGKYKTANFEDLLNEDYTKLLQRTTILEGDYKEVFKKYNSEDNFVFLDQPYDSTFNDYGNENFTKQNQIELFQHFKETKNKCLMVVGGSDFIRDLYKDFIIHEYPKKYSFKIYAGRIGDEINVNHLVVSNYKDI